MTVIDALLTVEFWFGLAAGIALDETARDGLRNIIKQRRQRRESDP